MARGEERGREPAPEIVVTDYDGTLAEHGRTAPSTVAALERWRAIGGKTLLVSGRQLEDLQSVFPRLDLFDLAVLENGALLFTPRSGEVELLADPPPPSFARRLAAEGVTPLSVGRVIVATLLPHLATVREAIAAQRLPLRIILNLAAVMVLPDGVDKGSGMCRALARLGLSPAQAVGIGDAENDLDFLRLCAFPVAVAGALDPLKEGAVLVTRGGAGAGVVEVIDRLIDGVFPRTPPGRAR